jgi:hypothetical protein
LQYASVAKRNPLALASLLLLLTACSGSDVTPKMPPTSSFGNAPKPVSEAILRLEDLPGTWALEDMAPDPSAANSDPAAQEVNRCLGIPRNAQPDRDRTTYSMYFAESPKTERSVIVNSSATVTEPGVAMDTVRSYRSNKLAPCLEPSVRQTAIQQYLAIGYDVDDAIVRIEPLSELQKDDYVSAYRSNITVSLNDGRRLPYYIDSFGLAIDDVYSTLTVFRDAEAPPEDIERKLLSTLEERARRAAKSL